MLGVSLQTHAADNSLEEGEMEMHNFSIEDINRVREALPNLRWMELIIQHLMGFRNDAVDFTKPHLKQSVSTIYLFFIAAYGVLVSVGIFMNSLLINHISRTKLYSDVSFVLIINIAIANITKCIFVLPVSLAVMLVQNWVYGRFFCFFLPMLQDVPMHTTMLSMLLLAYDRYRFVKYPARPRMMAPLMSVACWLSSVVIVLPYPFYIMYFDLGQYIKQLAGVGICAVNLADDMQDYMKGLFALTYALPLCFIAYFYIKAAQELRPPKCPIANMMFEARARMRTRADSQATNTDIRDDRVYDLYETELGVTREKRNQKYLFIMVAVYGICMLPLMILRVAKLAVVETYEISGHLDITFIVFVWIAFLPCITTPWIFWNWQSTRIDKEYLQNFFSLKHRRLRRSCKAAIIAANVHNLTHTHPLNRSSRNSNTSRKGPPESDCTYSLAPDTAPEEDITEEKISKQLSFKSYQKCNREGSYSSSSKGYINHNLNVNYSYENINKGQYEPPYHQHHITRYGVTKSNLHQGKKRYPDMNDDLESPYKYSDATKDTRPRQYDRRYSKSSKSKPFEEVVLVRIPNQQHEKVHRKQDIKASHQGSWTAMDTIAPISFSPTSPQHEFDFEEITFTSCSSSGMTST